MKRLALAALAALCSIAHADDQADAIQRELIQRDRQSAEFAHPALRAPDTALDQAHLPTRPDERQAQARLTDRVVGAREEGCPEEEARDVLSRTRRAR